MFAYCTYIRELFEPVFVMQIIYQSVDCVNYKILYNPGKMADFNRIEMWTRSDTQEGTGAYG